MPRTRSKYAGPTKASARRPLRTNAPCICIYGGEDNRLKSGLAPRRNPQTLSEY